METVNSFDTSMGVTSEQMIAGTFRTQQSTNTEPIHKRRSGFASKSPDKQRLIASKGGKSAHIKGTAHEFTTEEARSAGRKGGLANGRRR